MTSAIGGQAGAGSRIGWWLRRLLGGALAVAFVVLVGAAAAVVAVAALAVAAIMTLGVAIFWLVAWVRGAAGSRRPARASREREADGERVVLVARRGPHGWSVDPASR